MFGKKKILFLLTTAALVTACGGGGSGGTPIPAVGTPPAANHPGGGDSTPADQQLRGHLAIVANQVVYIRTDRSIYLPVTLNQFESDRGIYDIASGSKGEDSDAQLPPPASAPAAPIAAFGIRVNRFVQPSAAGQAVGNQTVVGRIAVDLTERDSSPGILANEVAEIMRFVIDRVELSTDENGELVSTMVREGAQLHVYGRNAAGVEVRETIPVSARAVRLLPISQVPDNFGDNSSVVLLLDLETAFSQAGQRLAALDNIAGHFAMHVTMSSGQLVRPAQDATAETPALERKDLVGQQIMVNNQPPVSGGGMSGNAWIRMYPPQ